MATKKTKKKAKKKTAKKAVKKVTKAKKKVTKKASKKTTVKKAKKATKKTKPPVKKKTAVKKVKKTTRKTAVKKAARKAVANVPAVETPLEEAIKPLPKTKLKKSELNKFRDALLEKRHSIIGDMHGMEGEAIKNYQYASSRDTSNPNSDLADIGSESYETEFTLGLLESERNLLNEIDEALARISDKTYGVCLATHKPIRKARLNAIPWCKYTLEHTQAMEGSQLLQRRYG